MFNYVQKAFVVRPLCFLGGILQVELMLANYSYVVLVTFFFARSLLLFVHELCEEQETKKTTAKTKKRKLNSHFNQFSYLSSFAIEGILHPLDSFLTQLKRNFVSFRPETSLFRVLIFNTRRTDGLHANVNFSCTRQLIYPNITSCFLPEKHLVSVCVHKLRLASRTLNHFLVQNTLNFQSTRRRQWTAYNAYIQFG